jgi:ectoine hydroxylase-related dioxygenase (phytanoyl-CoA dioxygenase family)
MGRAAPIGMLVAMTPAEIARRFAADGYVVLPDFLDAATNAELERELARRFADEAALAPPANAAPDLTGCDIVCWNPVGEGNPTFRRLLERPDVLAVTAACLGAGFTSSNSLVMLSARGGRGQAWHQDCRSDGGGFNLNRLLYTSDVSAEDGAVVVVPGSHRRGRIPPGDAHGHFPDEVELTPCARTLVLLHGWCWHRVTANRSRRRRVSINVRAWPAGCTDEICHIGVYRNHEVDFRRGEAIPAPG